MSRGNWALDEGASDLSTTSRACQARGIWRTTQRTEKQAALYTAQTAG